MCGRFTLYSSCELLGGLFGLPDVPHLDPRYNIAPTQLLFAVRADQSGDRESALLRWGLIPSWADDPAIGNRMINARSETVADKPAFRHAFRKRRCLIAATGFYEWQQPKQTGDKKQPYLIRIKDGHPFAFAGLWESWNRGDKPVESCTILTTAANDLMRDVHDRMPVILAPRDFAAWLDPAAQEPKNLTPLLLPYRGDDLTAYPVSTLVNSPKNDNARCIEPLAGGTDLSA